MVVLVVGFWWTLHLRQSPECWDYTCVPMGPAEKVIKDCWHQTNLSWGRRQKRRIMASLVTTTVRVYWQMFTTSSPGKVCMCIILLL
jgi:hypothetical protein